MWIKVTVWYKKEDEAFAEFERLGIELPKESIKKYDPDAEGGMLVNTDKIMRINPSSDNPEYSVLWFSEEPAITIHVKHSMEFLQNILSRPNFLK